VLFVLWLRGMCGILEKEEKKFMKKLIFVIVLGIICFKIFGSGSDPLITTSYIYDDNLTVNIGDAVIKAELISDEYTDSFLLIGGAPKGLEYFSGNFVGIQMDTVYEIEEEYGSFRRCRDSGAAIARTSTEFLNLYAQSTEVASDLNEVASLVSKNKEVVVEFDLSNIKINERYLEKDGTQRKMNYRSPGEHYYVTGVRILEKNREKKTSMIITIPPSLTTSTPP